MTSAVSKIIEDLRDRGGLKGTDVANIASVSPATVSRWTAGKALPHPKTQLVISDLRYVVDRLSEFYTPDETRLWLYSKHRLLNGERAGVPEPHSTPDTYFGREDRAHVAPRRYARACEPWCRYFTI